MTCFDVFNGDADGLCSLHQLRLAEPVDSILITGVKRDIDLLKQVDPAAGDTITVLDVSLDKNREALLRVLDSGARVRYVDHHHPGEIPVHDALDTHIDTASETCTGLIVDRLLDGRHRAWAVTAAFGDNLLKTAREAATPLGLDAAALATLQALGTLLNYNGYGAALDDLHFPPAELYLKLRPYTDPLAFAHEDDAFLRLQQGYQDDRERALALAPERHDTHTALYILPEAAWARRVSGVYANELAHAHPDRAHALLTTRADGDFLVSVRAPLSNRTGADALCRQFDTGGGRAAAAGVNHLPASDLDTFTQALAAAWD